VNNELEGSGHGLIKALSRICLEGLMKTTKVCQDIRTKFLPNARLESVPQETG
jgi:hypothetical protein